MDSLRLPAEHDDSHSREAPEPPPFTTSVEPHPDGRWVAIVNLGDGASATKVCDNEAEAARYGEDLLKWLGRRSAD